jgi:hypothetical protein
MRVAFNVIDETIDLGAEEGPVLIAHRHREVFDLEPQGEAEEEEHEHRQDHHVADQPGVSPGVDESISPRPRPHGAGWCRDGNA